jgi:hypothetical protein
MVETFELLVLPLWCRWGSMLLAVHIAEVGTLRHCTEAHGLLFSPPRPSADIMSHLAIEKDRVKVA